MAEEKVTWKKRKPKRDFQDIVSGMEEEAKRKLNTPVSPYP